jgi:hypothetical protein
MAQEIPVFFFYYSHNKKISFVIYLMSGAAGFEERDRRSIFGCILAMFAGKLAVRVISGSSNRGEGWRLRCHKC